ncbi:SHOCT domain-containing protein [Marine Group III euryarchaeote]|nr:SHOCT domain-containing protein [Marine Group III euryarchaeote]
MTLGDEQGMAIPESSETGMNNTNFLSHQESSFFPWDSSFWGPDSDEKLKLIKLIGFAGVGLSFLSLIFNYIASNEYVNSFCFFQEVFVLGGMSFSSRYSLGECYYWGDGAIGLFGISSVLSFPIFYGLYLVYFYGKNNSDSLSFKLDSEVEKILPFVFIILMGKYLLVFFYEAINILDYEVYRIFYIFLISELVFISTLLIFSLHMAGISTIKSSKEIISISFVFIIVYTIAKIYYTSSGEYSYSGEMFWTTDIAISYKLFELLQLISLPMFYYSILSLFAYRVEISPFEENISSGNNVQTFEAKVPKYNLNSEEMVIKLKEAQELLKQGIISEDEFKKIKEEYL